MLGRCSANPKEVPWNPNDVFTMLGFSANIVTGIRVLNRMYKTMLGSHPNILVHRSANPKDVFFNPIDVKRDPNIVYIVRVRCPQPQHRDVRYLRGHVPSPPHGRPSTWDTGPPIPGGDGQLSASLFQTLPRALGDFLACEKRFVGNQITHT
jgi:hypothetical protein